MAIEVEYFDVGYTGMIDGHLLLEAPTTGPNGYYDITVDPTDGPAQRYDIDFGITHLNPAGTTAMIFFNISGSDIKDVLEDTSHGVTGPIKMRVVYNY